MIDISNVTASQAIGTVLVGGTIGVVAAVLVFPARKIIDACYLQYQKRHQRIKASLGEFPAAIVAEEENMESYTMSVLFPNNRLDLKTLKEGDSVKVEVVFLVGMRDVSETGSTAISVRSLANETYSVEHRGERAFSINTEPKKGRKDQMICISRALILPDEGMSLKEAVQSVAPSMVRNLVKEAGYTGELELWNSVAGPNDLSNNENSKEVLH